MHVPTDAGSEDESVSSVHTDLSVPEQLASLSSDRPVSELPSPRMASSPAPDTIYSPEFHTTDSKQVRTKLFGSCMSKKLIRTCKGHEKCNAVCILQELCVCHCVYQVVTLWGVDLLL